MNKVSIADRTVAKDLEKQWNTIVWLTHYAPPSVALPTLPAPDVPDEFFNLPLVLAYCALDDALTQLLKEGAYSCKKPLPRFEDKMKAAKTSIPWKDWQLVNEGREARNGLAHNHDLCSKYACNRYIAAVGAELRNWGVFN